MHKKKNLADDIYLMNVALEQANQAYARDEVPVGAVLVDAQGIIIAKAHNLKESTNDPCGHAEILAIRQAAEKLKAWRLTDCSLYVTLEPCPMCLSAIAQARIERCLFGAYDLKGGSVSLGYDLYKDKRLNHSFALVGGLMHYECSSLISKFFREKRAIYKTFK